MKLQNGLLLIVLMFYATVSSMANSINGTEYQLAGYTFLVDEAKYLIQIKCTGSGNFKPYYAFPLAAKNHPSCKPLLAQHADSIVLQLNDATGLVQYSRRFPTDHIALICQSNLPFTSFYSEVEPVIIETPVTTVQIVDNPVSGNMLQVNFINPQGKSIITGISILSADGAVVAEPKLNPSSGNSQIEAIDISGLMLGNYILRITDIMETKVYRFVKVAK